MYFYLWTNDVHACVSRWKRSLSQVKENQPFVGSLQDFVHQSFWRLVVTLWKHVKCLSYICRRRVFAFDTFYLQQFSPFEIFSVLSKWYTCGLCSSFSKLLYGGNISVVFFLLINYCALLTVICCSLETPLKLFVLVAGFHLNLFSRMGRSKPNSNNRGRILLNLQKFVDVSNLLFCWCFHAFHFPLRVVIF
jgi:hypothetical protein